ncbi:hypothetical protein SEA_WOLLYPOG_29 [Arthrobacter phage Wollypog]|uniref:Uncharacterized protein n=1 Tax=Arthrobacter phage Wollypog TaxID=2790985 RepID=A0A7T3N274_9CAUD|nr:hypothetical protein PP291_gp29 [Arthrobacter phage Wollypog]QPX62581.1 hypothetical protein SEA_WOLLYPOG_29 [Arthrobacter phage Wollypog]
MHEIAGVLAALICAALFASAIWCFLRAHEGPTHRDPNYRKVYSVDKRPVPVRIRAFLHRSK